MEEKLKLSVSQLKAYTRDAEAFFLERYADPPIPPRPAPWSIFGSALHETFEGWELSDRTTDPIEAFKEAYDRLTAEAWEEQPDEKYWIIPPRTKGVKTAIANYRKRGIERDVPQYTARCLEAEWQIAELPNGEKALELPFEIEFDECIVRGHVDRVLHYPSMDADVVEDLKTGSPDDEVDVRQLALYRIGVLECYGIDIVYGRYWFTKLDRPGQWTDLRRYTREYIEEQYTMLARAIKAGIFLPNPGKKSALNASLPWSRELGWLKLGEPL
jgi:hypothetical protein